jgi:hypothetical protein
MRIYRSMNKKTGGDYSSTPANMDTDGTPKVVLSINMLYIIEKAMRSEELR